MLKTFSLAIILLSTLPAAGSNSPTSDPAVPRLILASDQKQAGQTVELKPGGLHMMLMGVKKSYVAGESATLTLTLEKAGNVMIEIPVIDMKPGMQHKM